MRYGFNSRVSCLLVSKRAHLLSCLKELFRHRFPEICWKYQVENLTQVIATLKSKQPPELILVEGIPVKEMRDVFRSFSWDSDAVYMAINPLDIKQPIPQMDKLPPLSAKLSPALLGVLKAGLAKVYQKRGTILPGSYKSGSILFEDLMYIRGEGSYSRFFLAEHREVLSSRSLGFFQCRLPEHRFVRIHKSFIVNLDFVEKPNCGSFEYLSLADHQTFLPVSCRRMHKLKSILAKGK